MLSAFRCHAGCCIYIWSSTVGVCTIAAFGAYPWQAYLQPGDGHWPTPGIHRVAAPSTTLSKEEPSITQSVVFQPFHIYGEAQSFGGLAESRDPFTFPVWLDGSSVPGLVPSDDMVNSESVVSIKPGDSGMVIEYQVYKFTHIWSVEQFVAVPTFILGSQVRCHN